MITESDHLFCGRTQLHLEYTLISFPNFHQRPAPGDKCSDALLSCRSLTADKHDLEVEGFSVTRPGFPVSRNKEQVIEDKNVTLNLTFLRVLVEDQSLSLKTI